MSFLPLGLALLALAGCPLSCDLDANLGKVDGDILFTNTTADVSAYLLNHQVIADGSSSGSVAFYPSSVVGPSAASTQYLPENTVVGPAIFKGASYSINPPVDAVNNQFRIVANSLRFEGNRSYRFGTLIPDSGLPATHACGPVPSLLDDADGIQCDVSECAQVVNVRLKLTGADADIEGLEPNLPPVACTVRAKIAETPGVFPNSVQADFSGTFPRDDLRGAGQVIPLLVRADGSQIAFEGACSAQPKPGEENFPINTSTGLADFGGEASPIAVTCPAASGSLPEVVIEIPVERNAGVLTGLFDLSGEDEDGNARVTVRPGGIETYDHYGNADPVPASSVPTNPWRIEGVPAGDHEVRAEAFVQGGDTFVRFPITGNRNSPPVTVTPGAVTDLGSTFIARPRKATGRIVLHDPPNKTDLSDIETHLFDPIYMGFPFSLHGVSSYVVAEGSPDVGVGEGGATGASGELGFTYGRLKQTWDAGTNRVDSAYDLLLAGISPKNGATDGSDALTTAWDVTALELRLSPPDSDEGITIDFNKDLHYTYTPPPSGGAPPLQVPEQDICFGKIGLEMEVDPALGTLYGPVLYAYWATVSAPTSVPGSAYTAHGSGSGRPRDAGTADSVATVRLTLPEGIQYPVRWGVSLKTPDGNSTRFSLQQLDMPVNGALACGQFTKACLKINDASGAYTPLSVGVSPTLPYCRPSGDFSLDVSVDSGGSDVDVVTYEVDGGATHYLCAPCGPDPDGLPIDVSTLGLGPGDHTISVSATGQGSCVGTLEESFRIPDMPLSLQCEPLVEVTLQGDESELPADDPRVAPHLDPQVTGDSCGLPTEVTHDPATIGSFPIGDTPVTFTVTEPAQLVPSGGLSCTTTVRVASPVSPPEIDFINQNVVIGQDPTTGNDVTENVLEVHSVLDNSLNLQRYSSPLAYHFEFDATGGRMAIIPNVAGTANIRIIDTATGSTLESFPAPSGYKLYDFDFDPQDTSKYAIVGSQTANLDQHAIFIYGSGSLLSRYDMPPLGSSIQVSRPRVTWSPDGTKISAMYTAPVAAANRHNLLVTEWDVVSGQMTQPAVVLETQPGAADEETVREIVYQDGDWRVGGTNFTITRAIKRPPTESIFPILLAPNVDLDLTFDGKAAAILTGTSLTPGALGTVVAASPLDQIALPNVNQGPGLRYATSVAISSDAKYVAVATQGPAILNSAGDVVDHNDRVLVYSLPNFSQIKEIEAYLPRNLEFRPAGP